MWRDYQDQKAEITQLLAKAEEELRRPNQVNADPNKISAELRSRHDAGVELRRASEAILRRLRSILSGELGDWVGPDRSRSLEEELRQVEQRVDAIRSLNLEAIASLDEFNARLKELLLTVESIVAWLQTAQKLLSQLLSLSLSPEERLKRTEELQAAIRERLDQLEAVEREASQLLAMQIGPDVAARLSDEEKPTATAQLLGGVNVVQLRDAITKMSFKVNAESINVAEDMDHWQEYSSQASELKPWLDEAEERTATTVTRPSSVSELDALLQAAHLFEDECKKQLAKLQSMSTHCQKMTHQSSAKDEVDALHSRWSGIQDAVVHQLSRLQGLQVSWMSVIAKMDAIVQWLDAVEAQLDSLQQQTALDSLENQLGDLKRVMKQSSEKQTDLMALTQECDAIVPSLSPEGASNLRGQVSDLKSRVSNLTDAARLQINVVSDAIMQRQDLLGRETELVDCLRETEQGLNRLNRVDLNDLDASLDASHRLMQQLENQQPRLSALQVQMNQLQHTSTPDEARLLTQKSRELEQTTNVRFVNYFRPLNCN